MKVCCQFLSCIRFLTNVSRDKEIGQCVGYLGALTRENPMKCIAKKNNKMDNVKTAYLLLPSASSVGPNTLNWDWLGNGNQLNCEKIFIKYEGAENLVHQLGIISETK